MLMKIMHSVLGQLNLKFVKVDVQVFEFSCNIINLNKVAKFVLIYQFCVLGVVRVKNMMSVIEKDKAPKTFSCGTPNSAHYYG